MSLIKDTTFILFVIIQSDNLLQLSYIKRFPLIVLLLFLQKKKKSRYLCLVSESAWSAQKYSVSSYLELCNHLFGTL